LEASIPPKGNILKLQLGANPNSSSVGAYTCIFLWSAAIGSSVLSLASALILSHFQNPQRNAGDAKTSEK
jgi:hypothetical protein